MMTIQGNDTRHEMILKCNVLITPAKITLIRDIIVIIGKIFFKLLE